MKLKVRVNQAVLHLLGGAPEFYETSFHAMPNAFKELVDGRFMEVNGGILFASFASAPISSETYSALGDETGLECFFNKIHAEDFFEQAIGLTELARVGCDMAYYLSRALSYSGIQGSFRVIVSAQPADEELAVPANGTLRFHKLRTGQAWIANDLEEYGSEAIAVLDSNF